MSATDPVPFPTKLERMRRNQPPLSNPTKAGTPGKVAPKWETECKERIRVFIRKHQKTLTDLVASDANEADTRLFITDLLTEALGYDKYSKELATEYRVKGEFADYGLRVDQQMVAFVECKRATTVLGVKHLRQVQMYAVNEGVAWVMLTNGVEWQVYHITGGLPISVDLVFTVNLLGPETAVQKATLLFLISREGMKKKVIDEYWTQKAASSPKVLTAALLSEPVLVALRKEVKRSTGYTVSEGDLLRLLRETVIRLDAL